MEEAGVVNGDALAGRGGGCVGTAMNAARPRARRATRAPLFALPAHLARRPRRGGAAAQLACLTGALLLLCVLRSNTFGAIAVASDILGDDLDAAATANFSPPRRGRRASARASLM